MAIRKETLKPYSDDWPKPTGQEVREMLHSADLTGSKAAALVGVSSRTVRKWTAEDQGIPYAAWALLAHKAGHGEIWRQN